MLLLTMKMMKTVMMLMFMIAAECDPVYWPWIIMAFSIVTVFACAIVIIICWYV